jgi:hypothetical protein
MSNICITIPFNKQDYFLDYVRHECVNNVPHNSNKLHH